MSIVRSFEHIVQLYYSLQYWYGL